MNMQISNNINFEKKYKTSSILQITTQKILEPEGMESYISTVKEMYGTMPKYIGCRGYKGYALELTKKIFAKYPQIKDATELVNNVAIQNKTATPKQLREKIQPIIEKLGDELDIVI